MGWGPARSSSLRSFKRGVPDSVQSSSVRNGRGLLRVSVEVVLYAEWSWPNRFQGLAWGVC